MCKNFKEKGTCKYGEKCLFAHGEHELTKRVSQATVISTTVTSKKEAVQEETNSEEKESD